VLDLQKYLNEYKNLIDSDDSSNKLKSLLNLLSKSNKNIFVFGNGGSAAIADHFAVDMTKNANKRTFSLNTSPLITCLSNDYGYELWMQKALEMYAQSEDIVFLISSSGNSKNVINACKYANSKNMTTITFTGFDSDNPLKKNGSINFWVNSKSYNIVENIHQIWILSLVDLIIGKSEYSAS
jgi:D-sedoheptulose 7-phosphate isomerase